jgi:hypothetical protein
MAIYDKIETWYICHEFDRIPKTCLPDLIACCDRALSGTASGIPFLFDFGEFKNPHAVWAFPIGPDGLRLDGGTGNLIFDTTRL